VLATVHARIEHESSAQHLIWLAGYLAAHWAGNADAFDLSLDLVRTQLASVPTSRTPAVRAAVSDA
jgi:hypothetical protein